MSNARTLAGLIDGSNIVVPSGYGLDFTSSSDSTATGVTVGNEVLSDYEEGTWTPELSSSGTAPTVSSYTNQSGKYTKLGNIVTVTCDIRANLSATGSGYPIITGLPFPAWAYAGASLGISNLVDNGQSSDNYTVNSYVRLFNSTYKTSVNGYVTFQLTYTVS